MDYSIEMCSLYDIRDVAGKKIIIFKDHNMAIPAWGTIRQNYDTPLKLITFDTHADTHAAFAREVLKRYVVYERRTCDKFKEEVLSKYNCHATCFNFEDAFYLSTEMVANDEQILVADYFEYIDEYVVFCALSAEDALENQRTDHSCGLDATYYEKYKIMDFSEKEMSKLCSSPFILDFDLDYFTTPSIFNDAFKNRIGYLIKRAAAITIAREPYYFDEGKTHESFNNQQALDLLLNLIFEAIDENVNNQRLE